MEIIPGILMLLFVLTLGWCVLLFANGRDKNGNMKRLASAKADVFGWPYTDLTHSPLKSAPWYEQVLYVVGGIAVGFALAIIFLV